MANRHLSRSIVLQTLFEWDFKDWPDEEVSPVLLRNAEEFAPGMDDNRFMHDLLAGVLRKREVLDELIEKAAPDWPLPKIANVDRNILRIGLYELLFADRSEVPPKVAINEAIELAKSYGGESSGRFVNGVLGSVYREIGEPGKDQTSSKKKIKDIPYDQMPIEKLVGAVVYAEKDGVIHLALVHDIFGHWTLSKGKLKDGEDPETAARRKVKEELGIDSMKIESELDDNEYIANDPEQGKTRKQVTYYLAQTDYQDLELPEDKGGLDDVSWFELSEIVNLNFYDDILPIVTKAVNILLEQGDAKK